MEKKLKKEDMENNIAKSVNKRPNTHKKRKKSKSLLMLILGIALGMVLGVLITVVVMDKEENSGKKKSEYDEQLQEEITSFQEEMLDEKGFVIETPIVDLKYPEKWKDNIRIEQVEGEYHRVQFSAELNDKEGIQLFDIVFGGEEGYTLGYLNTENNEQIPVNIISYDLELDDNWNEEERNSVYAMIEDVNYIIGMLQNEAEFEIAR